MSTNKSSTAPAKTTATGVAKKKVASGSGNLTTMALVMMNVTVIASLANDVQQSFYGLSSVTYFLLGGLLFFLPTGLVAAELASGWSERGGIFRWVGEGIGPFAAFSCILILWMQTTFSFGSGISSMASTTFFFVPGDYNGAIQFAEANHSIMELLPFLIGWLVYYWVVCWLATKGVKVFARIAKYGVLLGTFLPLGVIFILAIVWLAQGNTPNTDLAPAALLPKWEGMTSLALAAGVFFSFAGIDMNAAHIKDLKKPNKQFPTAIFISMILAILVFIVGTIIIAIVIPNKDINLLYTLYATYRTLGATIGFPDLYLIFVYLGMLNSFAALITNLAGPSYMLGQAGRSGYLPKILQNNNKHGMPSRLMYVQMFLMTVIAFVVFLLPNVEGFVALITQAITILYLAYYVLMFVAFLKLRHDQPNRPRGFRVPFGKVGAWVVAGVGTAACVFGIVLALFPPAQIEAEIGSGPLYDIIIIALLAFVFLICVVMYRASRKHNWVDPTNQFAPFTWQIEGLKKPGKVLSNIPSEIMSAGQDPMGMPIKRPYKPDEMMDEIPTAKDPQKQAEVAAKVLAERGITAPAAPGKVALVSPNANSVKTVAFAPAEPDGKRLHPLAFTSIPHVIVPEASAEAASKVQIPSDFALDEKQAEQLAAEADAKGHKYEVAAEAYKEVAAADEDLIAAEEAYKKKKAAAEQAEAAIDAPPAKPDPVSTEASVAPGNKTANEAAPTQEVKSEGQEKDASASQKSHDAQ